MPCILGFYSVEGSPHCISCPAGSVCPNTTGEEVTLCPSGTYSGEAAIECQPCPAGWQCPYIDGHGNTPCVLVCFLAL